MLIQILRIIHFLELDDDYETHDRVFCTVLSQAETRQKMKRHYKVDFSKVAATLINTTSAKYKLTVINEHLLQSKLHYLRLPYFSRK